MAHGEKLTIAMTVPNVPIADRRLNMSVNRASPRVTFERSMICSVD